MRRGKAEAGVPRRACHDAFQMTAALRRSTVPRASRRSPDRRTAQNSPSTELRRHGKRAGLVCFSQMKGIDCWNCAQLKKPRHFL